MKVLIVSFDKFLTKNLEKALSDHEVYVAKNSEEAIKVIPSDVEGVIYDAISGAISEEDINTLYTKGFSNARYIILYDELFPINEENILAPQKLLLPRDTDPKEIARNLVEFTVEREEKPQELEIEPTSLEIPQAGEQEVKVEQQIGKEEVKTGAGGKLLVVSFDQTLIDNLRASLGDRWEVVSVKTVKQAMEQGRDASVIVFDAISGVIAEKGLMKMAGDSDLSKKPYVILVDDLFPINVEGIPLQNKVSLLRDRDPARIKKVVEERAEETQQEVEVLQEVLEEIKEPPQEFEIEPTSFETPPVEEEEVEAKTEVEEEVAEEIPALEVLEKIIEEKGEEEKQEQPATAPPVDVGELIEEAVSKALSEDRIREAVLKALQKSMGDLKEIVSKAVEEEVRKVFEEIDVRNIVRQTTYQALKERLEELIS